MIKSQAELKGRRVALFGLSANPPTGHSGHLGIVRFLVQTGLFDEIWVLPVYQHMFAAKRSMIPFEHRVEMCHRCMDDESTPECRVRVMEIEKYAAEYYEQKKGPEYRVGTVDILDYIHDMCPGLDLHLVLGTDTYKDLIARKWKQADRYKICIDIAVSVSGVYVSIECLSKIWERYQLFARTN
jgi:nicotinic acid mononucleotide adenylyltransferase